MSGTGAPARGASTTIALGVESSCGVPAGGLTRYTAIPAVNLPLTRGQVADPSLDPRAYRRKGTPAPIDGSGADVAVALSSAGLLDFFDHMVGASTRAVLEPGAVFRYGFTLPALGDRRETSMWGLMARDPVSRDYRHGIAFGQMALAVTPEGVIQARLTGQASHGTRAGIPEPDAGNTGTYALGPYVRGPLAVEDDADLFIEVTSTAPLEVKIEKTSGAPTFPGSAQAMTFDTSGNARWTPVVDHEGNEIGFWTSENKDPFEILFPGTAADHGDIAVGDRWRVRMPGTWSLPVMSTIAETGRFGMAHMIVRARTVGAPNWAEVIATGSTLTMISPVTPRQANGTNYPVAQDRDAGPDNLTLGLSRRYSDLFFSRPLETNERLETEVEFRGGQIGSGAYRDSVVFRMPVMSVTEANAPVANAGVLEEGVTLTAETNDAGDAPYSIQSTTTRDWTPPA